MNPTEIAGDIRNLEVMGAPTHGNPSFIPSTGSPSRLSPAEESELERLYQAKSAAERKHRDLSMARDAVKLRNAAGPRIKETHFGLASACRTQIRQVMEND